MNDAKAIRPPGTRLISIATSPVGFIKVDVEGHEEEVIDGGFRVIARDHPVLLIEIEERHRHGALPQHSGVLIRAGV